MKIKPEVIMQALDSFGPEAASPAGVELFELVTRVHTVTGVEVPVKAVRAAVQEIAECPPALLKDPWCELVGKTSVRVVTPARRIATARAQELAALLDGKVRHSIEEPYAIVELPVAAAMQVARRCGYEFSWEGKEKK